MTTENNNKEVDALHERTETYRTIVLEEFTKATTEQSVWGALLTAITMYEGRGAEKGNRRYLYYYDDQTVKWGGLNEVVAAYYSLDEILESWKKAQDPTEGVFLLSEHQIAEEISIVHEDDAKALEKAGKTFDDVAAEACADAFAQWEMFISIGDVINDLKQGISE